MIKWEKSASHVKEQAKNATPHKFVNGYGEAIKRDITSLTYKRAQARLRKKIDGLGNIGVGKTTNIKNA